MTNSVVPDAKLLIAPGCAHCPTVLQHLATLIKENEIGRLEVINIQQHPEIAQQLNVRSVPWLQLGEYSLQGAYSLGELRNYLALAKSENGTAEYIQQQLADGNLSSLLNDIQQHPHWLDAIIELLTDDDTSIHVRLGIDSLIESLAGSDTLRHKAKQLGELSNKVHVSRLADIIHYLGLTRSKEALAYIEEYSKHENPDIREACQDAISDINLN